MLAESILNATGNENPVVVAAGHLQYESDLDLITATGRERGINPEVIRGYIDDYTASLTGEGRVDVPWFTIPKIRTVFAERLKAQQQRVHERLAAQQQAKKAKTDESPPNDKKRPNVGRRNHASRRH